MFPTRSLEPVKQHDEHTVDSHDSSSEDAIPSAVIGEDKLQDELEHSEAWVKREQRTKRRRGELPDLPSLEGIEVKPKKFQLSDIFLNQVLGNTA